MFAPGLYLIALVFYAGVAAAFAMVCLVVAMFPQHRALSLRAAIAILATIPWVIVYQLL